MRQAVAAHDRQARQVVLTKALLAAADALELTGSELAEIIGVSNATVSRMRRGSYLLDPGDKSWELAALLVRLFRGLDSLTGGDKAAATAWLRTDNRHLHAIPAELVRNVQGLVSAVQYVDAFRARL